jgi:hypothetical protein
VSGQVGYECEVRAKNSREMLPSANPFATVWLLLGRLLFLPGAALADVRLEVVFPVVTGLHHGNIESKVGDRITCNLE